MIFLAVLPALKIKVNSTLQKFHGCKMTENGPKNIDQFIHDFSHRMMKEMQLLMGKKYLLYINCHGIENLPCLFENRCLVALEGGETPTAYCLV